jgi:predicted dinucleotide-binding enzyme
MTGTAHRRVVVVGAGNVGAALGTNLLRLGHEVSFAQRRESKRPLPSGASRLPLEGAGREADLVVLAVPFPAVEDALVRLDLAADVVLVDATNPFGRQVPDGYPSGAALVAALAGPGARVVKAFNVLGAEHLADPVLPSGRRPLLPVAGDDPGARTEVAALARDMGFHAVEVGDLEGAALMEAAARYWGLLAHAGGLGRGFALVADQREE